ncbi:efflux RND transporter periplasmic adaptor subunit [Coralloluteibacterium thermophilus]|uniref:Efflux RND transporter periplasmic adaptor subunit n=1 Tax=Coralloluteibacterium thermophilum TaxID=2707049 RepID=A0ABV9NG79_9GAMM
MPVPSRLRPILLAAAVALAVSACGGGGQPQGMPPAQVSVITLEAAPAAIVNELPGRLDPTRVAQVRARVPGIVLERVFTEGSDVQAGDVLFRIDPAPLRAELSSAEAAVAQAEADAFQANALARRYEPLVAANAISQQEYDAAVAAQRLAQASIEAARARRDVARINLGYATVTAPISGRIGRAQVTEGALVGQGDVTPLATIQQLDPIYADFTQSAGDLARLRRAFESGQIQQVDRESAQVTLLLEDGTEYPLPGRLLFSDVTVDPTTGQVALRAEFPNPDGVLLPGTYVRVRLEQAVATEAITVPQQAVQRNSGGQTFVTVAEPARDADGQPVQGQDGQPQMVAGQRTVRLGSTLGDRWIVEEGLQAGDVVVVEGFHRAAPGTPLIPAPWQGGAGAGQQASAPGPNPAPPQDEQPAGASESQPQPPRQ